MVKLVQLGPPQIPEMFKLDHFEAQIVGERAVDIRLICLPVVRKYVDKKLQN